MQRFHPTMDKKVRSVKVRLTEGELDMLHSAAADVQLTLSEYIRRLIEDDVYSHKSRYFERKPAKKCEKTRKKQLARATGEK